MFTALHANQFQHLVECDANRLRGVYGYLADTILTADLVPELVQRSDCCSAPIVFVGILRPPLVGPPLDEPASGYEARERVALGLPCPVLVINCSFVAPIRYAVGLAVT